jgi:hypothetical protein
MFHTTDSRFVMIVGNFWMNQSLDLLIHFGRVACSTSKAFRYLRPYPALAQGFEIK